MREAGRLIALDSYWGRKVRTPKCGIAGNARLPIPYGKGPVQQKVRTDNAVVKSGKLYAVKRHIYRRYEGCMPKPKGRRMELLGDQRPR